VETSRAVVTIEQGVDERARILVVDDGNHELHRASIGSDPCRKIGERYGRNG
jgi:hypothetical protein